MISPHNRVGKKYLGCVLLNCIDVTIKFDESCEEEIAKLRDQFTVGNKIIFRVKSFVPRQRFIEGLIDEQVLFILNHEQSSEMEE